MSYGKRFWEIIERLQALRQEEQALGHELAKELGKPGDVAGSLSRALTQAATGQGRVAKPKPKGKKGELTKVVQTILKSYTRPAKLETIAKRVQSARPGTTQASVATVLHLLHRKGLVEKPEASTFQLTRTSVSAEVKPPTPKKSSASKATPPAPPSVSTPAPQAVEEEEGILIES